MRQGLQSKLLAGGIALAAIALSVLFSGAFGDMEQSVQGLKYRLRGESPVDSSIVVLYFDNPAIAKLGGLPLKRNYYALLIDALHDAGAKAIGVDIGLSDPDNEHPEYDQVLASVLRKSGNVVLSGYFQSISRD
ncbi:MAG TPA: CHASE2 domain-containing protein, partial [Bacteroidota bacterium]|nr:CHASE2 domain-containing protein [Bacteroidota bacterium]